MRLPLLAAFGLLAISAGALALTLGDRTDRTVDNLVGVPGVTQVAAGSFGLSAPGGTSPYAVYHAPANPPPPTAAPAVANAAAPAPPPPAPARPVPVPRTQDGGHHRRG